MQTGRKKKYINVKTITFTPGQIKLKMCTVKEMSCVGAAALLPR